MSQNEARTKQDRPKARYDLAELRRAKEHLRGVQHLAAGVVAGSVAGLIGAALWAVLRVAMDRQIGWMAVGIGLLVGFAVRLTGKGIDRIFGVAGAVIALLGCLVGNFLAISGSIAARDGVSIFDTIASLAVTEILPRMVENADVFDGVFYVLAVLASYWLSVRQPTNEELARHIGRVGGSARVRTGSR
ncbi:MAG: hypothetical protein R3344_07200 [Acidobacteriota bacterium]|nr:hypothetical protein [Acidobacteriota bacterium]